MLHPRRVGLCSPRLRRRCHRRGGLERCLAGPRVLRVVAPRTRPWRGGPADRGRHVVLGRHRLGGSRRIAGRQGRAPRRPTAARGTVLRRRGRREEAPQRLAAHDAGRRCFRCDHGRTGHPPLNSCGRLRPHRVVLGASFLVYVEGRVRTSGGRCRTRRRLAAVEGAWLPDGDGAGGRRTRGRRSASRHGHLAENAGRHLGHGPDARKRGPPASSGFRRAARRPLPGRGSGAETRHAAGSHPRQHELAVP
mmetsp:Transcript_107289/g.308663  ORF Transcript_107289/g.308663 Transcript_107289/m.308663 type:complete len:250 (+) Transcript_107289:140-889(+)